MDWDKLIEGGVDSMINTAQTHFRAYAETGIGSFYGNKWSGLPEAGDRRVTLQRYIDQKKKPGTEPVIPSSTSCIGYVFNRLEDAYNAAGELSRWNKVERRVRLDDPRGRGGINGLPLLKRLREDGWELLAYFADSSDPYTGTDYTGRVYTKSTMKDWYIPKARDERDYFGIEIDHFYSDFAPKSNGKFEVDPVQMSRLESVPFWVGIASGDLHVFCGRYGKFSDTDDSRADPNARVILHESHQSYPPEAKENIEEVDFASWATSFYDPDYFFGAIAVPPATFR